jgi:hemolysin activation/secretion protein
VPLEGEQTQPQPRQQRTRSAPPQQPPVEPADPVEQPSAPRKRAAPAAAAPAAVPDDEALRVANEHIKEEQASIANYLETIDGDDEVELDDSEAANVEAARELVATEVPDRPRYLRALTRAREYMEGVLRKNGYTIEGDE